MTHSIHLGFHVACPFIKIIKTLCFRKSNDANRSQIQKVIQLFVHLIYSDLKPFYLTLSITNLIHTNIHFFINWNSIFVFFPNSSSILHSQWWRNNTLGKKMDIVHHEPLNSESLAIPLTGFHMCLTITPNQQLSPTADANASLRFSISIISFCSRSAILDSYWLRKYTLYDSAVLSCSHTTPMWNGSFCRIRSSEQKKQNAPKTQVSLVLRNNITFYIHFRDDPNASKKKRILLDLTDRVVKLYSALSRYRATDDYMQHVDLLLKPERRHAILFPSQHRVQTYSYIKFNTNTFLHNTFHILLVKTPRMRWQHSICLWRC